MKKIARFILLILASFVIITSCENQDDDLKSTNTFEIVKPSEIVEDNKHTKLIYENDLIVKIYIEKENTLPKNPSMGMLYETEFEKDTFSFEYENGTLLKVNRVHHKISFNGMIERIEEQNHIEYNTDNLIKSISFSNPLPGKKIFIYNSQLMISKIEYEYESSSISSSSVSLGYNDNNNLTSYCIYSDTNCSDASLYDNHSNPYYSINQLLGYPFFTDYQHLSRNNPLKINNIDNTTNIVSPSDLEFSYDYDDEGRVVKINDNIEFKY